MSTKTLGRIIGALLLIGFLAYGGGRTLVEFVTGTPVVLAHVVGSETRLTVGALLMLLNSGAVIGIAAAAYPVLKRHHPITASVYLLTRGFEAALLASGAMLLLTLVPLSEELATTGDSTLGSLARVTQAANEHVYWVAMIGLSLGSLLFCRALYRARLVPRPLAAWGFGGYALLAIGGVLELLGHHVGLLLSVPGGLFEMALAVLLLVKGFPETQIQDVAAHSFPVQPTRLRSPARV